MNYSLFTETVYLGEGPFEVISEGKCYIPLTEEQCKNVAVTARQYKWSSAGSWPGNPSGCYTYLPSSNDDGKVYFNRHSNEIGIGNREFLCLKGNDLLLTLAYIIYARNTYLLNLYRWEPIM